MLKVGVNGALGRMGRMVTEMVQAADDVELACALEYADHPDQGKPVAEGIILADKLPEGVDVLVVLPQTEGGVEVLGHGAHVADVLARLVAPRAEG